MAIKDQTSIKSTSIKSRSRIRVMNLPRYVSKDRLRELFSLKGEITDVRLIRTRDGKSRLFGFVGYKTEQEAEEAIKYFHKTFIDTCKITCEIARKVGDPEIRQPLSRHSLRKRESSSIEEKIVTGSKRSKVATAKGEIKKGKKVDGNDDPKFQEFLQVMQPRRKSKLWANDAPVAPSLEQVKEASGKKLQVKAYQEAVKVDSSVHNEVVSDVGYFRSRVKIFNSAIPSSSIKDEKQGNLETGRLLVTSLPYTTTEEELEEHFSKFGDISEVNLIVDKDTKRSVGSAYVVYVLPEAAARALENLNNSIFQGRILHVVKKERNPSDKQEINSFNQKSLKTFKRHRNEERKASEVNGNTRGWNRFFMRTDTVVENIARKFGVSKSALLDRDADDPALQVALGETKVIAETKNALSNAGINVALLESASWKTDGLKGTSRVILVKNLPYGSCERELAVMFRKFGNLEKVILPPTKTLALVIFVEPADAYASFLDLRYKCYKGAPLYLELVPGCVLSQAPISMSDSNNNVIAGEHDSNRFSLERQLEDIRDVDVDPDRIESRSLYVTNLNFKTLDENLKRHFAEHMKEGRILSVSVNKYKKNGKNVSSGFAFIEFDSVDTAVKVFRDLQNTKLDGHDLILELCRAKKDEHQCKTVDSGKSSTKLTIKNVAFEATKKDLRQLFNPFGQVKSLRLPKRFGNHKGYAFVEYVTKQEAQNALQALSNTHLYGRHLVLERANEDESLEKLRARIGAQFTGSTKLLSKKRKHMNILDK